MASLEVEEFGMAYEEDEVVEWTVVLEELLEAEMLMEGIEDVMELT